MLCHTFSTSTWLLGRSWDPTTSSWSRHTISSSPTNTRGLLSLLLPTLEVSLFSTFVTDILSVKYIFCLYILPLSSQSSASSSRLLSSLLFFHRRMVQVVFCLLQALWKQVGRKDGGHGCRTGGGGIEVSRWLLEYLRRRQSTFPVAGNGCSLTRSVNLLNIFLIFWFYLYFWFPCPERQSLSLVYSSTQAQEPGTPQGLIPLRHPTMLRIELAPRPPRGFPQAPRPLPASLQVSYCSLPT